MGGRLDAITLDLDDTLWPVDPVIERAEAALMDWFAERAPGVLARLDLAGLRRIRAEADREARVIVAEARRDAEIARGQGDAEATQIYAEAYGPDPEFYGFMRSLEAYEKTIGEHTTLVLSPKAEFFRFFERANPEPPGEDAP